MVLEHGNMVNQGLVHFWAANWSVQNVEDALLKAFSSEPKPLYLETFVSVLSIHDTARRGDRLEEVIAEQDALAIEFGFPSRSDTLGSSDTVDQLRPHIYPKEMDFDREHMPSAMENFRRGLNSRDKEQKARFERFLNKHGGESAKSEEYSHLLPILEYAKKGAGRPKKSGPREQKREIPAAITAHLKEGLNAGKASEAGYLAVHGQPLRLADRDEDIEFHNQLRRPVSDLINLRKDCKKLFPEIYLQINAN